VTDARSVHGATVPDVLRGAHVRADTPIDACCEHHRERDMHRTFTMTRRRNVAAGCAATNVVAPFARRLALSA
jgi:hypothetical protein